MINRFVTLTRDVVWPRRWWILTPTVVTAILTSVLSYYFLPTRYRSESIIDIVSPQPAPAPLQRRRRRRRPTSLAPGSRRSARRC